MFRPMAKIAWLVWGLIGIAAVGYSFLPTKEGAYSLFRDTGGQWLAGGPLYDHNHLNALDVFRYSPVLAVMFVPLAVLPALPGMLILHGLNLGTRLVGLSGWGSKGLQGPGDRKTTLLLLCAV